MKSERQVVNKDLSFVTGQDMDDYLNDLGVAQQFAALNRKAMVDEIIQNMGWEVEEQFDTIHNYIDLENIDLKVLADKNIEKDSKLASLIEQLPRIEEQKRVDQLYSDSLSVTEDYEKSIQYNETDTKNRINEIKYTVYSDYYNLKSLSLDIRIAQNDLKLAKSALEVVKVKESLGLVTSLEAVKAEKDVLSAENAVTNALNSYYKAYHDFVRYY